MNLIHDDTNDPDRGGWVRLTRGAATLHLNRWAGPDRPIYSTDYGWSEFDHHDPDAPGGPETVYRWAADRENP